MNTKEEIAAKLREIRDKKGLSQKEVGQLIGITSQAVTQAEGGKQSHTLSTLQKFADALECNLTILITPIRNRRQSKKI